jgi:hypothetical protein
MWTTIAAAADVSFPCCGPNLTVSPRRIELAKEGESKKNDSKSLHIVDVTNNAILAPLLFDISISFSLFVGRCLYHDRNHNIESSKSKNFINMSEFGQ